MITFLVGAILISIPSWPLVACVHHAARHWRGRWRVAAVLTALPLTVVIVRILVDTSIDPTSHNLWPFEILIWSIGGLIGFGLVALLKRAWSPPKPPADGRAQ